jgi:hypothetical protein
MTLTHGSRFQSLHQVCLRVVGGRVFADAAGPDQRVLFNLDDVDVWPGITRAASGQGGATDWELLQLRSGGFPNVEFWQGDVRVEESVRMTAVSYSGRRFQLWEYRVSHGGLLIRSPKGPSAPVNVDLVFDGVEFVSCRRLMRGIELLEASSEDLRRVVDAIGVVGNGDRVFVLSSEGVRHLVVASSLQVSEHDGDIFDSPF